jgi:hypothetical protein
MKLISEFQEFLNVVVNLNQSRIDLLESRVSTLKDILDASSYEPRILRYAPQGSWAHGTIIKPPKNKDFDADLIVFVDEHSGFDAADYVETLYQCLRSHGIYHDMVSRGTRCVEVNYSGDFHLDLVPCIQEACGNDKIFRVCNRIDNDFESTNSEGYTSWLSEKNRIVGKNLLAKSIRLIKYKRDIKQTFSAKSILLTTLIGGRITILDEHQRDIEFPDLPTALKTIIGRLDDFLQQNVTMPLVKNPVLPNEHFNRHLTQEKYDVLRNAIHRYRGWIDDAYSEPDYRSSIEKWRRVFGEDFAKIKLENVAQIQKIPILPKGASAYEMVEAVRKHGADILTQIPESLLHVQRPPWASEANKISVTILAQEYAGTGRKDFLRKVESGNILQKSRSLQFRARLPLPGLPSDFIVKWRVVNTGEEAVRNNSLRGDFYDCMEPGIRWETTLYRGVHWVEAFLIKKANRHCVGKSERFFVVIE